MWSVVLTTVAFIRLSGSVGDGLASPNVGATSRLPSLGLLSGPPVLCSMLAQMNSGCPGNVNTTCSASSLTVAEMGRVRSSLICNVVGSCTRVGTVVFIQMKSAVWAAIAAASPSTSCQADLNSTTPGGNVSVLFTGSLG